ncbi:hypothetical protein P9112_006455 [Eukaryota sp. TZLM1-RC]
MFKSYKIESFLEPLLANLADESDRNSFGGAFLGGRKNFVFEFFNRVPNDIYILNFTSNTFLRDLQNALDCLPSEIWSKYFPDNVQETPSRTLVNLRYFVTKLQQKLTIIFEGMDFNVRLGSAKKIIPLSKIFC